MIDHPIVDIGFLWWRIILPLSKGEYFIEPADLEHIEEVRIAVHQNKSFTRFVRFLFEDQAALNSSCAE